MKKNLASLTQGIFVLGTLLVTPLTSGASTTLYFGIADNGSTNGVDLGYDTDVASDSTGAMHACYYDYTNTNLLYSTNTSGKWVSATVDSTGSVGTYCSIAVDSSDKAHISYYDATNYDLKYATNASGAWVPYSVVSTNSVGMYSGIALDSSGNIHISYYDATNGDLAYTTGTASTATPWPTTAADSSGSVGTYTSIAIDSSGAAHISYYDATNKDLKYATNESSSWVTTTVDSNGSDNGKFSNIALDSSEYVHISYYGSSGTSSAGYIMHADNLSGSWDTDTIASASASYNTHIALAADDTIYISYYSSASASSYLYYASAPNATGSVTTEVYGVLTTTTGHSWTTNSAFVAGYVRYPAMTLDVSENPFFIYNDYSNKDLKFASADSQWNIAAYDGYGSSGKVGSYASLATNGGSSAYVSYYDATDKELEMVQGTMSSQITPPSSWTRSTIDTAPSNVGYHTSIAVDGSNSGSYYIAYQDVTNSDAEFYSSITTSTITYNSYGDPVTSSSTSTSQETIDSTSNQGRYSNIAVDPSTGYSHVVYYDATNYDLKYATNESGAWVTTIVDGATTQTGQYPDIAIDSTGQVHISYYNLTGGGKLRYATDSDGDGVFETETVDSSGGVTGQYTSIGIDRSDVVHIAYYLYSTHDLRYAYGNAASWTKTFVDTSGDVGRYASLAVLGENQVLISYYDATNTDLKYATDSDGDGTFETETVDSSSNDVGKYSSIALNDNTPVIVYYDATAQDLRMAVSP